MSATAVSVSRCTHSSSAPKGLTTLRCKLQNDKENKIPLIIFRIVHLRDSFMC